MSSSPAPPRSSLTQERMLAGAGGDGETNTSPIPQEAFSPWEGASLRAPTKLEGRLTLGHLRSSWRPIRDDFNATLDVGLRDLPTLAFSVTSRPEDGLLLPDWRGLRPSPDEAAKWWWVVGAGRIWREGGDGAYSRAALPFTLVQPHANCSLHGTLTFLYDVSETGEVEISNAYYQISQETCLYLKLDMWGWLASSHAPLQSGEQASLGSLLASYDERVAARPETAKLEGLRALGLEPERFAEALSPAHITIQGVYWNGTHYHSGCQTRQGALPFCDEITLPSYSTAKSLVAGLAYFALAKDDALDASITLGSQLQGLPSTWGAVTLGELLSMTSGHYDSTVYMADEDGARMSTFFLATGDGAKTDAALSFPYQGQAQSPAPWVYHSSDTFLAFRLMQSWSGQDLYDWIVANVFEPLRLSDATRQGLRTDVMASNDGQHFGSHGSWWLPSDLVLLSRMLQEHADGTRENLLDAARVERALQRTAQANGVSAGEGLRYHRGFWSLDVTTAQGFPCDRRIAFMSGFGGITVVLLPNGAIYYVFSDNAEFAWLSAAAELAKLGGFCTTQ